VANWVDRSNAAGNGVVSLAAAYAWRTLKAAHLNL
jgi:DNA (cytosine-5)-methyltransferase 1